MIAKLSVELKSKMMVENKEIKNETLQKPKTAQIKLPKFQMLYFYGESKSWISFQELFDSAILENKSLNRKTASGIE